MGKAKAILIALAAVALCAAVLALVAFTSIDDDHYGWLITRGAKHFAGVDVTIEDYLSLELSSEPLITGSRIQIRDPSGPTQTTAEIDRFELRIALWPLISGNLVIRHLLVDDGTVSVVRADETGGSETEDEPFDLSIPVLERVVMSNVGLTVTDRDKEEVVRLLLDDLSLDDVDDKGPLNFKGRGTLNAKKFELDGQLGALADMRTAEEPYPIDLRGKAADMGFHVSGTVDKPTRGEGLNLRVTAEQGELADTLRLFWKEMPNLGRVQLNAQVTGDVDELSLPEVDLKVSREGQLDFTARGSVSDLLGNAEVDLSAELTASDMGTVTPLLEETRMARLGPVKGKARFEGSFNWADLDSTYRVKDIQVSAGSKDDFRIEGAGFLDLVVKDASVSVGGLDVEASLPEPGASAKPSETDLKIPDLRPVRLTARMLDRDGALHMWDIEEVKLDAGTEAKGYLRVDGRVQVLAGSGQKAFDGSFEGSSKPWIEKIFEGATPEDYKVQGKLKVVGTTKEMRIEKLTVSTMGDKRLFLEADGRVKKAAETWEFEGNISSGASDQSVIQSFLGMELPPFAAPQLGGRFNGNLEKADYEGTVRFGESEFKTTLSHSFIEDRPHVTGKVGASSVRLADLGLHPAEREVAASGTPEASAPQTKDEPKEEKRLFSDRPWSFDRLKAIDLFLRADIGEMIGSDFTLKNLDFDMSLENGKLHVAPATIAYENGSASMDFAMDTAGEKPEMALKVTAEDVDVGAVFAHFHTHPFVKGQLNLVVDLTSVGSSPEEIATALGGELGMAVEQGKIKRDVDLLGADAIGFMMAVRSSKEYQDLNCLALRFVFKEGIGKSEVIYMETPEMFAKGVGKIDLHSETMKIALQPKPKKGLPGTSSAVKIEGPIADPKVRKLPFREAAQLYGEIAMPIVFLPLRGLGYLLNLIKKDKPEESPCMGLRPSEKESAEVQ